RLSRDRVSGAVHPRVVVGAPNDPLFGFCGAGEPRDDVIERLEAEIELELEVHARGAGAEAIRDWKATAPPLRNDGPGERREQWLCVTVRDRPHGTLRQRRGLPHLRA